jgi:predicted dehydrogenase
MEKLRYAIIGCGRISGKHIEAIIANRNKFIPVACVDIILDKAQNAAARIEKHFPDKVNTYTSYEKMLQKEELDIVAVCTYSGNHADISLKLLDHDINVISEKPMALSTKDCNQIIEKEKKTKAKFTVSMQNRFNRPIQKLRNAIDENKLGKIYHGQISVRWNRNLDYYDQADWRCTWKNDGGALMNQCSHGIDLLQWMMGSKPKSVYGIIEKFNGYREAEDFGSALIEFDNGSIGIIEGTVNTYPRNLEEKLSIFGEKGTVVVGGIAVNYIETWRINGEEFQEKCRNPPNIYGNGHLLVYNDFFRAIINDKDPYINAKDGKKAVEIILGIYKSYKTGEKIKFPIDFSTEDMTGTFKDVKKCLN